MPAQLTEMKQMKLALLWLQVTKKGRKPVGATLKSGS
jgi:hypothetical protein